MGLTINLPIELERRLRRQADAEGLEAEAYVQRVIESSLEPPASRQDERPLHELIADVVGDVPEEQLGRLPADGAEQLDHYAYGLPKR